MGHPAEEGDACNLRYVTKELGATKRGPKGDTGLTGKMGPGTGPAGQKGDTGSMGPAGPARQKGNTGSTGPAGPAGHKGDTGSAGPAGPAGPTGSLDMNNHKITSLANPTSNMMQQTKNG